MTSDPPDPISLDRYFAIHDATLREFDHLFEQDISVFQLRSPAGALHRGRLHCVYGLYLQFEVLFGRLPANMLRVGRYTFHAGIVRQRDRPIFRYDNAHSYEREGQPDPHHKHRFDVLTGSEIVPPEWIGAANQPTLRSVLVELEQWWTEIGRNLEL